MKNCLIYGTGGHAKVVAALAAINGMEVSAFFDDRPQHPTFLEVPVHRYQSDTHSGLPLLIAIGNNKARKDISIQLSHSYGTLVHPTAVVAGGVAVQEGTVILSAAVIQTEAVIGRHCLINISCAIDHEAVIHDFAHIAPGCYIGGGAVIGEGAVIGPGAVIMRHAQVPAWANIAPGSVITS